MRVSSFCCLTPQMTTGWACGQAGPGQIQEPGGASGSPVWVAGKQVIELSSCCFAQAVNMDLNRKCNSQGTNQHLHGKLSSQAVSPDANPGNLTNLQSYLTSN